MAAELSYKANAFGKKVAEVFTVRLPAWHREGTNLEEAPDYDSAIKFVDYPVEKRPHYRPAGDGTYRESRDSFYTVRGDTQKVLGTVGSSYEVVPNREAFEVLKPLVDEGVLKLETGGVLRDGADAWLLGRWQLDKFGPDAKAVLGGEVLPYSTVMANHSGRRGILVGMTPTRLCCANTLGMAEREADRHTSRWIMVDHRAGARGRLVDAAQKLFGGVVERYEVVARQYRLLKGCVLSDGDFTRLVLDAAVPDPVDNPRFVPEAKLAHVVKERADKKRREIRRMWTEGSGHTGEKNAWFALNGLVEVVDHDAAMFPTRKGSWRTGSLLDGQLAEIKNRVTQNLVSYALGV
jgi:phage/plasmid-like protein (TIGR03299 family)